MLKRVLTKSTKPTSICKYCNKTFASRGLSLHQRRCNKKLIHNKAEAKKTRAYKFCILNESVHEEILSFLSNQSLTKMQMITGDHYEGCEPELAQICCKCENDNYTVGWLWCQECIPEKWSSESRELVSKQKAKVVYGVEEKELKTLACKQRKGSCVYEQAALETFVLKSCGSKKQFLRRLVTIRARWEKYESAKKRKKELCCFLANRAPDLGRLKSSGYKDLEMEDLKQWYPRFEDVEALCSQKGVRLLDVLASPQCKGFIKNGFGRAEDVVNGSQQN
ncbi:hypothetical protein DVH05_009504 [Phytophthora capsici]|nr:hypothetical protein DVH05_009504 [Phytophthora capsici]